MLLSGAQAAGAGLSDQINCASAAEEKAHGAAFGGNALREIVGGRVGGHDTKRMARTVRGKGSWLSYRVQVSPRETTTLEFEEIDGRDRDVYGYLVLVDNKKVFLRTWQGSGAGPVHFFVQVPPTGKTEVTVKLVSQTYKPFSLSRLWVYSDFARYFAANRFAVPYYIAPTLHLKFNDRAADRAALDKIKSSLGDHPHAKAAFTAFIPYAALNARQVEERVDYALALAEEMGMPVQLGFDTWWGSTPGGMDGKGGYWTDVLYQQVVYNASTGSYQLSVPNRWSSTPWLSVNQPELLAFKVRRLTESMRYLKRRRRELRARSKHDLILSVNLDNEPVYWASGNAGLGSDLLLADFNPATVAAAKRDRVTLDPVNGLSFEERRWLFQNLLGYNERIGSAAVQGLGRDAMVVEGAKVVFPDDPLAANVYTQAMVADDAGIQYPMLDAAYPFWETAAPASVRVGGEWNGDSVQEQQAVLHQIALGRNAAVNAESSNNAEKMKGVRVGYALAQRFYTLYNYPLDKMAVATREIRDTTEPFPAFRFQPVLAESSFRSDTWKKQVAGYGDVQTGLIGNTAAIAAFPASPERPGYLLYKLENGAFASGLFLELTGRAFVSGAKDPRVNVRVLAGSTPHVEQMQEKARFFDTGYFGPSERIDLSDIARGKSAVYVRIEMNAPTVPASVLSWCSVRNVRFTTPWPLSVTGGLAPQDESLDTMRHQNLIVSWRRDAEIAINTLAARKAQSETVTTRLASARAAYDRGAYADAYRLANEGQSIALPAVYEVTRTGSLAPYNVRVEAPAPVAVTVREQSEEQVRLTVEAASAVETRLHLSGLASGAQYIVQTDKGELIVQKATAGAKGTVVASSAGELTVPVTAKPYPVLPPAAVLRGVLRSTSGKTTEGFSIYPEDGSSRADIRTNTRTIIRRGQPGQPEKAPAAAATLADLRRGDQVEARIGADGVATVVTVSFQTITGEVGEFGPLTPSAMPFVSLRDASDVRHIIDLSAPLHLPTGDASFRTSPMGTIMMSPGTPVTLHINPRTNRVYELWVQQPASQK